jgi:hypothetical protein
MKHIRVPLNSAGTDRSALVAGPPDGARLCGGSAARHLFYARAGPLFDLISKQAAATSDFRQCQLNFMPFASTLHAAVAFLGQPFQRWTSLQPPKKAPAISLPGAFA